MHPALCLVSAMYDDWIDEHGHMGMGVSRVLKTQQHTHTAVGAGELGWWLLGGLPAPNHYTLAYRM